MTKVKTVHITEQSRAAAALIDALAELPGVSISEEELVACAVCGTGCPISQTHEHKQISGRICGLCDEAADHIEKQVHAAHVRAWSEFSTQLPQLIRDRRNGAPEPTFYRGFE